MAKIKASELQSLQMANKTAFIQKVRHFPYQRHILIIECDEFGNKAGALAVHSEWGGEFGLRAGLNARGYKIIQLPKEFSHEW